MFKKKLLPILILALLTIPTIAYAIDIPGWPLVPCGLNQDRPETPNINEAKPCGRCDLFQLLKNITDFVTGGLMPPLAILFFVWAGFLILLSGANPGLYAQGQTIFKNTFYGIIILLAAWMITNTLILSIGAKYNNAGSWWEFTCTEPAPVSPPVVFGITTTSLPSATVGQPYNQTIQVTGGTQPFAWTQLGSLPAGLSFNAANGAISGTPTTAGTSAFTIRVTDNSSPPKSSEKRFSITVGDVLPTLKYGCNNQNRCIQDPSGQYTSPLCNSACSLPPANLTITTTSLPNATQNQPYSQTVSATGGLVPYFWSVSAGSLPAGIAINSSSGAISGTPATAGTSTFTILLVDNSTPPKSATKQLSIVVRAGGTLACMFNNVDYSTFNLCSGQSRPGGCGTSVCSQYLPSINKYAGGAATVDVLKAFMVIESDCNIKAATGTSYGLMQISPATANPIAYKCGLSPNSITSAWLTDPANADKSICLGAEIIRSIAAGTCGSQPRNIYAGYNAGPGYCAVSNDCAGEQSCGGGAKKKWECPYDNPQHTVCNTRMYQTKQGATYINYCLNNLGF